jgi:hypothetical protein
MAFDASFPMFLLLRIASLLLRTSAHSNQTAQTTQPLNMTKIQFSHQNTTNQEIELVFMIWAFRLVREQILEFSEHIQKLGFFWLSG